MTGDEWSAANTLVNELTAVLREYRRSYHSIPDAYGYCHLGAIHRATVERADAVIAKADRALVQPAGFDRLDCIGFVGPVESEAKPVAS